jgi:sortase A
VNTKLLGRFFLTTALILFAKASWISAKASVAQLLIANAWETTLTTGMPTKPWHWADTWPVLTLITPTQDKFYVLQTTSGQALAFGPGLLDGSARPGQFGNTVIAAHRDTHFEFLEQVKVGDIIQIQDAQGNTYRYRIEMSEVVDSRHKKIQLQNSQSELTLITCYPFHALNAGGSLRYVVHSVLI